MGSSTSEHDQRIEHLAMRVAHKEGLVMKYLIAKQQQQRDLSALSFVVVQSLKGSVVESW